MRVEVRSEVRLTENEHKVKRAILNFFKPDVVEVIDEDYRKIIICRAEGYRSLLKLYDALRKQRILDAARSHLKKGVIGNTVVFHIHKQAAYVGKISFCTIPDKESPLGAITFVISCSDVERLIDWLTPMTIDGTPFYKVDPPEDP
ncbi:MAG: hypothetical protein DRJ52_00495 [Thermoprotei archaeon]|nr:MAG: hypothetical protein DRJ52_00495 [Thermoprotei archaeon]RLF00502.1 MAG: hypothetical protein DRJ63_02335 [Thermoprotei archaeon]HDI74800.1 hypothetical protein [Thermoprotei archaeon]